MWPLLFDLLPHFARLMPMADKFLATRSASEKAQEAALAAMAESVRGDLGQVAEAHAGIKRALQEQSKQTSEIAVEVTRVRMGVESIEARIAPVETRIMGLEKILRLTMNLLATLLLLFAGLVGVLVYVVVHLSHR
jgi:septal ring factor EnvC (AmiA/AmiB activator)